MAAKEEILKTYLETLTSLPVYADEKPKGNNHCIVYRRISTRRYRTHNGTTNFERVRFQLDVFGISKRAVREIAEVIKNGLDGNKIDFETAVLENDFDVKEIEGGFYRSILDFFVW